MRMLFTRAERRAEEASRQDVEIERRRALRYGI
jgi:hypothetical protein